MECLIEIKSTFLFRHKPICKLLDTSNKEVPSLEVCKKNNPQFQNTPSKWSPIKQQKLWVLNLSLL